MENLIIKQLDKTIVLPDNFDFEVPDKSQLLDQLKVLQIVLRKARDKSGESKPQSNASPAKKTSANSSQSSKELEDLKAKIEKHKQAALDKRQNQLKKMDVRSVKVEDQSTPEKPAANRKRTLTNNTVDKSPAKKVKNSSQTRESLNSSDSMDSQSLSSQNSSHGSSQKKSIIEDFASSSDRAARMKKRDQAVAKMIQAGHKMSLAEPGEFALKYALSAPYHYFFNRVEKSKVTHDQQFTVTFPELLDVSLGDIVDSLHINFMVELGWLCLQYLLAAQNPKMTIFCGQLVDPQTSLASHISLVEVKMPTAFGCHHTKVSVFKYSDGGIRIVVSTANIYSDDWENRTQG